MFLFKKIWRRSLQTHQNEVLASNHASGTTMISTGKPMMALS
jgi:hypothetical protein